MRERLLEFFSGFASNKGNTEMPSHHASHVEHRAERLKVPKSGLSQAEGISELTPAAQYVGTNSTESHNTSCQRIHPSFSTSIKLNEKFYTELWDLHETREDGKLGILNMCV